MILHTLTMLPLCAVSSPLVHVRDLTVAFKPEMTIDTICAPFALDRTLLLRLLPACKSLQRLHLHFHLRRDMEGAPLYE